VLQITNLLFKKHEISKLIDVIKTNYLFNLLIENFFFTEENLIYNIQYFLFVKI